MTTATDNLAAISNAFENRVAAESVQLSAWPIENRIKAMESFRQNGFPQTRLEDWKYTDLSDFAVRSSQYLANDAPPTPTDQSAALLNSIPDIGEEYRIVFVNGVYIPSLSSLPVSDDALTIRVFSAANFDGPTDSSSLDTNPLVALNSAFMSDGLDITIADNQEIQTPVNVLLLTDGAPCAAQVRMSIRIGTNASARIIQQHQGQGESLVNTVTSIDCSEDSRLSFIKLQNESSDAQFIANQFVSLAARARYEHIGLDFGGQLARSDLNVSLQGPEAEADLNGVFVINGDRHVDNHLRVDHAAGHTVSHENFRGILSDSARGVFNGKIIVHSGADGTDANMSNHNLLLGDRAEIDTKPELEIYTDDVKCAHGSTTGRLDMNSLFYLRARGVPESEARRMLVAAFAKETIAKAGRILPGYENYLEGLFSAQLAENTRS